MVDRELNSISIEEWFELQANLGNKDAMQIVENNKKKKATDIDQRAKELAKAYAAYLKEHDIIVDKQTKEDIPEAEYEVIK